jgi:hypothetical protein
MRLTVEFLGLSRRLAQVKELELELGEPSTYRDALQCLASQFPALLGQVIVPNTFDLVSSHIISIDGRRAVTDVDARVEDGQRLIFMFAEAGG